MESLATRQFLELERVHWWFEGRRRIFFTILEDLLRERERPLSILDVGCGVGGMMEGLRRFGEPVGLELSIPMIERARERGFPRLVCGSAEELPVAPSSFDLITLFDCLEPRSYSEPVFDSSQAASRTRRDAWMSQTVVRVPFAGLEQCPNGGCRR